MCAFHRTRAILPPSCRPWRGVARRELREEGRGEGREERVRLLQLEWVERPTPSSSVLLGLVLCDPNVCDLDLAGVVP